MNHSLVDINQYQTKRLSNFCDEYNLSMSSLTIFPIYYDCFIQISPNNIYIAFVKNNNILEIYVKENKKWEEKSHTKLSFDKQKIKGINWSPDSNLILVYGSEINGNNSNYDSKNYQIPSDNNVLYSIDKRLEMLEKQKEEIQKKYGINEATLNSININDNKYHYPQYFNKKINKPKLEGSENLTKIEVIKSNEKSKKM